jgi:hypothetical protein
MTIDRRKRLLVFVDAVGITSGYKSQWDGLLHQTGIQERFVHVVTRSAYGVFKKGDLLEWSKTRKQPGFNTDLSKQAKLTSWVDQVIQQHQADMVCCMDPALLFLLNPVWSQATLDKLRGGVYIRKGIPWVVSLPITAIHNKMKQTDIAKLNEGFTDKVEYEEYRSAEENDEESPTDEEDEETMEWHEPIIVPMGVIMLRFDFQKIARLLGRLGDASKK